MGLAARIKRAAIAVNFIVIPLLKRVNDGAVVPGFEFRRVRAEIKDVLGSLKTNAPAGGPGRWFCVRRVQF